MRASCLKVLEVATTWSGAPKRLNSPTVRAISARTWRRSARTSSGSGRVAGQPARGEPAGAERQRDGGVGFLVDAVRDLQGAAADVEDQQLSGRPAEPAAGGEEGEPGLLLAGEDLEVDAGLGLHAGEDLVGVGGLAHRGGRERQHAPRRPCPRRPGARRRTIADEPVDAVGADGAVLVEEFGEAQLRLVRMGGQRAGARVRVHHQQMHRVRTHVEDSESHGRNATAG